MANIQIRKVPPDVHRTLRIRAAAAGQSLQEYLLAELTEHASTRDLADVVAEARADIARQPQRYAPGSSVEIIRQDRNNR